MQLKGALRAAALIAVLAGAVGSLGLLFLNGNGRRQIVLMILFVGWVLLPYMALAAADKFSPRWSAGTKAALHVVSLIVTLGSLAIYGGLIAPPPDARPAFTWLMVPLGSMVLIAGVALAGLVSRGRSGDGAEMKLNPHLTFDGQCEAAFTFYARCLSGAIVTMLSWGKSPMAGQVPAAWREKILHATLTSGDIVLTGADVLPDQYQKPQGISVQLGIDDPAAAERVFAALADGGTVQMPIQQTFWAKRYGVLVDRFGIPWEINC